MFVESLNSISSFVTHVLFAGLFMFLGYSWRELSNNWSSRPLSPQNEALLSSWPFCGLNVAWDEKGQTFSIAKAKPIFVFHRDFQMFLEQLQSFQITLQMSNLWCHDLKGANGCINGTIWYPRSHLCVNDSQYMDAHDSRCSPRMLRPIWAILRLGRIDVPDSGTFEARLHMSASMRLAHGSAVLWVGRSLWQRMNCYI